MLDECSAYQSDDCTTALLVDESSVLCIKCFEPKIDLLLPLRRIFPACTCGPVVGQDTTSLRVILTVSLQLAMNSPKTTGGHDQNSLEESLNRRTWLFMGHGAEIAIARLRRRNTYNGTGIGISTYNLFYQVQFRYNRCTNSCRKARLAALFTLHVESSGLP